MKYIKPNKALGQNFLQDKNLSIKIVKLLGEIYGKNIIEIGPGMGALTDILLDAGANITAYDKDERAINYLKEKYNGKPNFNIFQTDIREVDLKTNIFLCNNKNKIDVIGNIPYNISTDILFWLFKFSDVLNRAVLTLQKEVAERLVAKCKTKNYGVTTIATKLYCNAKIVFHIPSTAFFPPPKVTSSVLVLDFNKSEISKNLSEDKKRQIMLLAKAAFSQRRKIINNSIKQYLNQKNINNNELSNILSTNNIRYLYQRAEELSVEDYIQFYEIIKSV